MKTCEFELLIAVLREHRNNLLTSIIASIMHSTFQGMNFITYSCFKSFN